jgi:D-alanyl-D-alanine carboxypeptidase
MCGHPGNIVGFSRLAADDPQVGTTVVILTNVYLTPQGDSPKNALFLPVLAQLYPEVAAQLAGGPSAAEPPSGTSALPGSTTSIAPTSLTGPGR